MSKALDLMRVAETFAAFEPDPATLVTKLTAMYEAGAKVGDLTALTTPEKGTVVGAINSLVSTLGDLEAAIDIILGT